MSNNKQPDEIDTDDLISMSGAARRLKVSRQRLGGWVKKKRLSCIRIAGKPFLFKSEVIAFKFPTMGRPPLSEMFGDDDE